MKKLLLVVLVFVSCVHYNDYTPADYSHADSIKIVQIQPLVPDTTHIQIRIPPQPLVIEGPPSPDISGLRSQFLDRLNNVELPDNPIPVDSLSGVLNLIQSALDLAASHMSEELSLRERFITSFINSEAISFTFRSLNDWFDQQGCIERVLLPDYENVAHPHINGLTSMPLQIPVSVTLNLEQDNAATHQFSMLLEREPSFKFLPGM